MRITGEKRIVTLLVTEGLPLDFSDYKEGMISIFHNTRPQLFYDVIDHGLYQLPGRFTSTLESREGYFVPQEQACGLIVARVPRQYLVFHNDSTEDKGLFAKDWVAINFAHELRAFLPEKLQIKWSKLETNEAKIQAAQEGFLLADDAGLLVRIPLEWFDWDEMIRVMTGWAEHSDWSKRDTYFQMISAVQAQKGNRRNVSDFNRLSSPVDLAQKRRDYEARRRHPGRRGRGWCGGGRAFRHLPIRRSGRKDCAARLPGHALCL